GTAGSIAYSQASVPWMIQSASVFGLWSITFLLTLTSSLLALMLRRPRTSRVLAGVALILFGANVLFGVYRLSGAPPADKIHVAMIDSDALGPSATSNDGVTALSVVNSYLTAARSAIKNGATVIVMPEKMAVIEPAWRQATISLLRDAADENKVTIIAGF